MEYSLIYKYFLKYVFFFNFVPFFLQVLKHKLAKKNTNVYEPSVVLTLLYIVLP